MTPPDDADPTRAGEEPENEEMAGLVDILRELVTRHLPGEIEHFETLLVDFAALWTTGEAVRRVLERAWSLVPGTTRLREVRFIAEAAALGRCTATEARALIDLDYGGARSWFVRRALRRATIQRSELHQFDRGENLVDRLPANVWDSRTSRARELWNTAREQAAAGRAAAQVLIQLVGLLQAADPQRGWTVSMVSYRAMNDGACTAEERDQVVEFCRRWEAVPSRRPS